MKLYFLFLFALFVPCINLQAQSTIETKRLQSWEAIEQHSIPDDHPIKSVLDAIFSSSRVLASNTSFINAGFYNAKERRKGLIVTSHPSLEGYLVKLYLDTAEVDELELFMKRVNGAKLIANALDRFDYNHLMKVPKKWIYPLPSSAPQVSGRNQKNYILVVEDAGIYTDEENRKLYKSIITPEHLQALFDVLTTCLLSDSTWLPNIPFSHDGKIAFIDTEFAGSSQTICTRLTRVSKYLNSEMRKCWATILLNNPKPKALHAREYVTKENEESVDEELEAVEARFPSI